VVITESLKTALNDNIKLNEVDTVKTGGQVKMLVVCKLTKIYRFHEKAANKAGR
jgi:hypothetical protein